MSVSYVRIVKADEEQSKKPKRNHERVKAGFDALSGYMAQLLTEKYADEEIDHYELFNDVLFANNYMLADAMGLDRESLDDNIKTEEGDELVSLLDTPIYTPSVALWMQRIADSITPLKDVIAEDEEENGSLNDLLKTNRGIRADISKFIAAPSKEEREMKGSELKGIYNLLSKANHPIAESLYHTIGSDTLEKPKRAPRKSSGRVRLVDPAYIQELQQAREEQQEGGEDFSSYGGYVGYDDRGVEEGTDQSGRKIKPAFVSASPKYDTKRLQEARRMYGDLFDETSIEPTGEGTLAASRMKFNRPTTPTIKIYKDYIERVAANEKITVPQAFDKIQDRFNKFMVALTGEKAFGTSGRAGRFGGEIEVGQAPNAMSPSLAAAAEDLGIVIPREDAPNIPDEIAGYWLRGKDPMSDEVRDAVAQIDTDEGFHFSLMNAMREGGVLDTELEDKRAVVEGEAQAAGTKEEREMRAKEAREGVGTQSALMTPEDELKIIQQGNERTRKIKVNRETANLEYLHSSGQISDNEYQMRKLYGDSISAFDPDKIMDGIEGKDFGKGHAFYGKNAEQIAKETSGFVDNLIGMGRLNQTLKNLVVKNYSGNETAEDRRAGLDKFKELNLSSDDLMNIMEYYEKGSSRANMTEEQMNKYKELTGLLGQNANEVLADYAQSMNKRLNRFKELGISPSNFMEAAVRYAGEDMTEQGYSNALQYLHSRVQGGFREGNLSEFATGKLLRFLEKRGRAEAKNNEYHMKVDEQNKRFARHRTAMRHGMGPVKDDAELRSRGEIFLPEKIELPKEFIESNKHLIHDPEDCNGCHHSRFMTSDAETAREESPGFFDGRSKTPYTRKMMQVPILTKYKDAESNQIKDLFLMGDTSTQPSIANIADFIFPDGGFSYNEMMEKQEAAEKRGEKSRWRDRTERRLRRKIKEAVVTGNSRAQNIYNKFGLFKEHDYSIASGPAGYSNNELIASSFLLPSEDAYDTHYENARLMTINAIRYEAMLNAMDLLQELSDGKIADEKGNNRKVALSALRSESGRKAMIDRIVKQPNKNRKRAEKNLKRAQDDLQQTEQAHALYQGLLAQLEADEAKTKPQKVMEDGVERTYPGEYSSPSQKEILKKRREQLKAKYGPMLKERKKIEKRVKDNTKRFNDASRSDMDSIQRYDDYALGAFMGAGGYIVKAMQDLQKETKKLESFKRWRPEERKEHFDKYMQKRLSELILQVYPEGDDTILQGDEFGKVTRDYQHQLSNYKLGKVGEMAGTGVRHFTNNKALPRPNDMNQLRALRRLKGHESLSAEDQKTIEKIMKDADVGMLDEEVAEMLGLDPEDMINHSSADHSHHDSEEDGMGMLTEAEMRRRHQNSHFTRGAEEEIEKGNISADLISNWPDNAPTLCGSCHGHGHINRGEAASWVKSRVAGMSGEDSNSPKMNKYIADNMRPRDHGSWGSHPMYSDEEHPMGADDHEQIACPDCEHDDPGVIGGKISNGLCSHCFSSGMRDPEDNDMIHNGYIDQDGNFITGKLHNHHTHSRSQDAMNQLFAMLADYRTGGTEIPDYLKEVIQSFRPASMPHEQYENWLKTGLYTSKRDLIEARKKEKTREPLSLTPMFDFADDESETPKQSKITTLAEVLGSGGDVGQGLRDLEDRERPPYKAPTGTGYGAYSGTMQGKVHGKLMDAHINKILEDRVAVLSKYAKQTATSDDDIAMIDGLVNEILNHPHRKHAHGDEDHPIVEPLDKLQELAERHFATEEAKRMPLPMGEEGELGFSPSDYFAGKELPIQKKATQFEPKIFAHGRFMTSKEYYEGLFDPAEPHRRPKEPTFADMVMHYRGDDDATNLLYRMQQDEKFKQHEMDAIMEVINDPKFTDKVTGTQRPMNRVNTTNIESKKLNALMEEFGGSAIEPTETGMTATWNDEFLSMLKEKGVSKSKLKDTYLFTRNAQNQKRGIGSEHDSAINEQIRPLWKEYVKRMALRQFIQGKLNKLDYPNLNDNVTVANFAQLTMDDNTQPQFYDEAAMLAGFTDEEDMDKKLNMKGKITIGKLVLDPQDFKNEVLAGANVVPIIDSNGRDTLPIVGRGSDGKIKPLNIGFGVDEVTPHIMQSQEAEFTDEEKKKFDLLKKNLMYEDYPNWMRREAREDILHGDENEDGMDFSEMKRLYKEHDLPLSITSKLDESQMLLLMHHPDLALTPSNYDESLQFDFAQKAMHDYNAPIRGTAADMEAVRSVAAQQAENQRQAALNQQQAQQARAREGGEFDTLG